VRRRAISQSGIRLIKGLRRHVKRRHFSLTFKALSHKRQALLFRLATLSQQAGWLQAFARNSPVVFPGLFDASSG
jgi:hypothetical protein